MTEIIVSKSKLPKIRPHGKRKYPFATMKVNDSFQYDIKFRASVGAAGINFSKKYKDGKWKFAVNQVSDSQVLVIRVK
jgi:hypothetical protein